jgi:hypothetical protein
MKAYHNYTTAMTTAIRLRWGTAVLLILAALVVGLMLVLSTNGQSALPLVTSDSFARHSSDPIIPCRACRDEWIAAQAVQPAVAAPAQRLQAAGVLSGSRAAAPIASCRACRDEWVAAQVIQLAVSIPAQRPQATGAMTISRANAPIGPCRVCRDEWIATQTTQSILAAISASPSRFDLEQPAEQFRTSSPR